MNKYVSGAYGVSVQLNATEKKFAFPDIPLLRGKRIKHIDFCAIEKDPAGKTCVTTTNSFITLVEWNTQKEMIQNLHVGDLNNNGDRLYINKIVDFTQSYVTLPGAVPGDIDGKVLYFVIWFDDINNRNYVPQDLNRCTIDAIELPLTGLRTYFSENLKLKNKKIQNLLLTFPLFTASGNTGLQQVPSESKFLTLSRNNVEFFSKVPLILFYQSNLSYQLRLQNIQFDFQSSYIETLTTTANDLKTVFFNAIIDDNK